MTAAEKLAEDFKSKIDEIIDKERKEAYDEGHADGYESGRSNGYDEAMDQYGLSDSERRHAIEALRKEEASERDPFRMQAFRKLADHLEEGA